MENKQTIIRMPIELYERLKKSATKEKRSINLQVVHMIEEYLKNNPEN